MIEFEKLKKDYQGQQSRIESQERYTETMEKGQRLRAKQRIGQIVLSSMVLILVAFFIWISAFDSLIVTFGASLMIGSLVVRIIIEFVSVERSKKLNPTITFLKFKTDLKAYHKSRMTINHLVTPILFVTYIIGFIILLPSFEASLSKGFYHYILVSSVIIFIALAYLIYIQGKKELRIIRSMEETDEWA